MTTKYRYKVLRGEVAERARDLIRQICQAREVQIVRTAGGRFLVELHERWQLAERAYFNMETAQEELSAARAAELAG